MSREKNTPQTQRPASVSLRAAVAVACLAGCLGCASTAERSTPLSLECPEDSVVRMLEASMTQYGGAHFPGHSASMRMPVKTGQAVEVSVGKGLGVQGGTRLTGYVAAVDRQRGRAYLFFTQATTPQGQTFPVCVQALGDDYGGGLRLRDGTVQGSFGVEARLEGSWRAD